MAEMRKPSDLPKAKKHKLMDSDEDDKEPHHEPGTSSNPLYQCYLFIKDQQPVRKDQLPVPTLRIKTVKDSGKTVLDPDLYVLTNDEDWTVPLETHMYVAAAGSFCL